MEWEKIFAHCMSDMGSVSKIYKELIKLNSKKNQITQLKKWAKDLNRHFLKGEYKKGE